jgi:predicted ATPase
MADKAQGITKITIQGFKSLYDETSVEIRPLTLLAGANSSGKSSIMQPLLLMKQTLEAEYATEAFVLEGSHVKFSKVEQFTNEPFVNEEVRVRTGLKDNIYVLEIGVELEKIHGFFLMYSVVKEKPVYPMLISYTYPMKYIGLSINSTNEEIIAALGSEIDELRKATQKLSLEDLKWRVIAEKGFMAIALYSDDMKVIDFGDTSLKVFPIGNLKREITNIIHVPGLRGNPQRSYPTTTIDAHFEGTFEPYTASLIHHWAKSGAEEFVRLIEQVRLLGLTSHVTAEFINDAQLQVLVARTMDSEIDDMVSIADVGFGVSQVLPVLVALLVAKPGQLVYLEQPELHLHPRAQTKLAEIIADAAKRGVRVVVETHSSLLLLGVQTLIAENNLNYEDVILHWFKRGEDGKTTVTSVEPDKNGAYGAWPEDFADVELDAQSRYLDAVAKREVVE